MVRIKKKESGAVLVISLIILLVLIIIAVSALRATSENEKISGNLQELNIGLQSTESALREAEAFIEGLADLSGFGTSGPYYNLNSAPDAFQALTWTGAASVIATQQGSEIAARYFIELLGEFSESSGTEINVTNYGQGTEPGVIVFRIVGRGTGASGTAQVIVETFYGRMF